MPSFSLDGANLHMPHTFVSKKKKKTRIKDERISATLGCFFVSSVSAL